MKGRNPFVPGRGQVVPLGRVEGEGEAVYRSAPAITRSMFVDFIGPAGRPSLFHGRWVAKTIPQERFDAKTNKAFEIGLQAHTLILEGEEAFGRLYVETPKFGKTEAEKVRRAVWGRENRDRRAVPAVTMRRLERMRDSVHRHRVAHALLSAPGKAETTWRIDTGDCLWQCRTDWFIDSATPELCEIVNAYWSTELLRPGDAVPVNLKTCQTLNDDGWGSFRSEMVKLRYDIADAFYRSVISAVLGIQRPVPQTFFIAVEKQEPMETGVYIIDSDDATAAWQQTQQCISRLRECLLSGEWPGVPQDRVQAVVFPGWRKAAMAREIGEG